MSKKHNKKKNKNKVLKVLWKILVVAQAIGNILTMIKDLLN